MQTKIYFIISFITASCFFSCTEIGPDIDFTPVDTSLTDTTYVETTAETPQQRVVLFEDFTGVQCVNCPSAHEATADLLNTYPDQLIVVAEHNYFLGAYPESAEDYRIPEADDLNNYLGPALGWPAGVVDRYDFAGTGNLTTLLISNYVPFVEDRLDEPTFCNVYITNSYDSDARKLNTLIKVVYTADIAIENHLSVMILESGIIDLQLGLSGIDENYVHDHVLRDMLTPSTGTTLSAEKNAGRVFEKEFSIVLPDNWNETNLEIVAFVHNFTNDNKEVLQGAKQKLFE